MRSPIRIVSLTIVTLCAVFSISAQDLGSANKLFGSGAKTTSDKKASTSKKNSVAKRNTTAHGATANRKPSNPPKASGKKIVRPKTNNSSSTTAKHDVKKVETPAADTRSTSTRPREVTTPTGKKITRPANAATDQARTEPRKQDDKRSPSKVDNMAATPVEKRVTAADEARFEDLIQQGNTARDDREYARAESAYKNARTIKPRDARAIYGVGNVYSDQQRWEEAENAYRTALQLEPSSAMTHIALSYVLTQPLPVANLSDRYAEAEKLARRASELSPRSALAFDQLGVAMEMRGELGGETESAYRKALALDASFAPAYAHLGRLLRRRGLTDQSRDAYTQATERSTDVGTTVLVAEVMQSEQHYGESIPLLRQALAGDPRNPSALLMLGHALTVKGEYRDAETALRKALTVSSNGYQANLLLASLYMRQGAFELAENALLQALRWAPAYENRQLAQQFVMLAQGYSKAGKADQSRRAYAQAAKLDPDSGMVSGRFRQ